MVGGDKKRTRCDYDLCDSSQGCSRKEYRIDADTRAGGQDWSPLAGWVLCKVCYDRYSGRGTLERTARSGPIAESERRCTYEGCEHPEQSNRFHPIAGSCRAGGQDWGPLAGNILCGSCYHRYKKRGTLKRAAFHNKPLAAEAKHCTNAACLNPHNSRQYHRIDRHKTAGGRDWSSLDGEVLCYDCYHRFRRFGRLNKLSLVPGEPAAKRRKSAGPPLSPALHHNVKGTSRVRGSPCVSPPKAAALRRPATHTDAGGKATAKARDEAAETERPPAGENPAGKKGVTHAIGRGPRGLSRSLRAEKVVDKAIKGDDDYVPYPVRRVAGKRRRGEGHGGTTTAAEVSHGPPHPAPYEGGEGKREGGDPALGARSRAPRTTVKHEPVDPMVPFWDRSTKLGGVEGGGGAGRTEVQEISCISSSPEATQDEDGSYPDVYSGTRAVDEWGNSAVVSWCGARLYQQEEGDREFPEGGLRSLPTPPTSGGVCVPDGLLVSLQASQYVGDDDVGCGFAMEDSDVALAALMTMPPIRS